MGRAKRVNVPISMEHTSRLRKFHLKTDHDILKLLAVRFLLKQKRFSLDQIYNEYSIKDGDDTFVIDVVGEDDKRKIAIECGQRNYLKLARLKELFDEVHWMGKLDWASLNVTNGIAEAWKKHYPYRGRAK